MRDVHRGDLHCDPFLRGKEATSKAIAFETFDLFIDRFMAVHKVLKVSIPKLFIFVIYVPKPRQILTGVCFQ
jgi:hypothetical protein